MKAKYVGQSFGVDSLTNGKVYTCLGHEGCFLRIIDDSGEDYLYSATDPAPLDRSVKPGKWEIIEDDDKRTLYKAINQKEPVM